MCLVSVAPHTVLMDALSPLPSFPLPSAHRPGPGFSIFLGQGV